jgi:hypothetical protein
MYSPFIYPKSPAPRCGASVIKGEGGLPGVGGGFRSFKELRLVGFEEQVWGCQRL